jgi:membrane protein DedA with SNARE-associated domain
VNGVRRRTFILADALSALLSVPLVVSLGYFFAAHLEEVKKRVHEVELAVLVLAIVAATAVVIVKWYRAPRLPLPGEDRGAPP